MNINQQQSKYSHFFQMFWSKYRINPTKCRDCNAVYQTGAFYLKPKINTSVNCQSALN